MEDLLKNMSIEELRHWRNLINEEIHGHGVRQMVQEPLNGEEGALLKKHWTKACTAYMRRTGISLSLAKAVVDCYR